MLKYLLTFTNTLGVTALSAATHVTSNYAKVQPLRVLLTLNMLPPTMMGKYLEATFDNWLLIMLKTLRLVVSPCLSLGHSQISPSKHLLA